MNLYFIFTSAAVICLIMDSPSPLSRETEAVGRGQGGLLMRLLCCSGWSGCPKQSLSLPASRSCMFLQVGTQASHPHQPTCLASSSPQSTKPAPPGSKRETSIRPLKPHAQPLANGPGQVMESHWTPHAVSPGITQHEGGRLGYWWRFGPASAAPGRRLLYHRCSV